MGVSVKARGHEGTGSGFASCQARGKTCPHFLQKLALHIRGASPISLPISLGWPAGATKPIEDFIDGWYAACAPFPVHPRPGFHDPVTADIPTLVLSGLLDTQTAASWGPETARHLPRGQAIVFPETGHGALVFSQCARDLGVAFIENPRVPLDQSCVAGLKPTFVLPEGLAAVR
jgi:hypothetical protein